MRIAILGATGQTGNFTTLKRKFSRRQFVFWFIEKAVWQPDGSFCQAAVASSELAGRITDTIIFLDATLYICHQYTDQSSKMTCFISKEGNIQF